MFALILAAAAVCPPHLSQIILVGVLYTRCVQETLPREWTSKPSRLPARIISVSR
jgi:hypothetical protein